MSLLCSASQIRRGSSRFARLLPTAMLALMAILATPSLAQEASVSNLVRNWNGRVLEMMSRFEADAGRAAGKEEAVRALARRAQVLGELFERDPAAALSLSFSGELPGRLARLFPEAQAYIETEGTWTGPVEYEIADDETLTESWTIARMPFGGQELEIRFAGDDPEDLQCGDFLEVRGVRLGNRVVAAEASLLGEDDESKEGRRLAQDEVRAASACSTLGTQRVAVLLVTFPGVTPPNITKTGVWNLLFGSSGRTMNNYWLEASYGQTSATGDVFGWYTLDSAYSCDQTSQMRSAAILAADAEVNFRNYTRIFILFPKPSTCSYAGRATVGCTTLSSPGDGSFVASTAWMVANYFANSTHGPQLALHEGGHNLGLMHSRSRRFASEPLGPLATAGTINEYGDTSAGMGSWNWGHYPIQQKEKLGWLGSGGLLTVQSAGTYSILPLSAPAAGLRGLKVQRGTGNNAWLWVEYRQPQGLFDNSLNSQIFTGATIRYADATTGTYTDLLDFTPNTTSFADPALAAGRTWEDPYSNLALAVNSATSSELNLSVSFGSVPCTTSAPQVSMSPANPSVEAGSSVSYTVSITNNDSASCTSSTYSLESTLPQGWMTGYSASQVTLAPGETFALSMTKQVPAGTAPGTYATHAVASRQAGSGSAAANCTVLAPKPELSASVAVSGTSFKARDTVSITGTVLSGNSLAPKASVVFTLMKPNGAGTTRSATTDAWGKASWAYRFGPKDPPGVYRVSVTATYDGQTATSAPVEFTLR